MAIDTAGHLLGAADEQTFEITVWSLDGVGGDGTGADQAGEEPDFCLKGHTDEVNCLRFFGYLLAASASADRSVRRWSLAESPGACLRSFEGFGGKVWSVDVDRKRLVAGGRGGQVRAWMYDRDAEAWSEAHCDVRVPAHGADTSIGQVRLDRATLVTADGLGRVVASDFWRPE